MVEVNYSIEYIKVILILLFLIGLLLLVKKYLLSKNLLLKNQDLKIISQQMIDPKNKLTLFQYKNKQYLILTGENGFLIDSFDSFEKELQKNQDKVSDQTEKNNKKLQKGKS